MMANGITGAHPKVVSPEVDGPGTRATGITVATSSSTGNTVGTDSKAASGYTLVLKFQSDQESQEDQESADPSTYSRAGDIQILSPPRDFQDVKLEVEEVPDTTCGRTMLAADSSVVDLHT